MGQVLKALYSCLKKIGFYLLSNKKTVEIFMCKTKYHDQITWFVIVMILRVI